MNKSIEEAAELLRNAYISGPVNPLRQFVEPTDADLAYKIQNTNTEYWISEGREIAGWKIGLTAKAVQRQLGVNQPDFGVLFSDMAVPTQSIFQM
ncbi:MAG: 2-keto-4-pentenoate hydratase, partial [Gammaproteobacteria bacterium]|nr:2-keto-4-pentenoate hydratase [Gammaproteobacteria bacterium]